MTLKEFVAKYRPAILGIFADFWANRKMPPSEIGLEIDRQHNRIGGMLQQMFQDLTPDKFPPPAPDKPVNGTTPKRIPS